MALSADDRKEMVELMAEGMAQGLAKFRSDAEEAAAKAKVNDPAPTNQPPVKEKFSFSGWLLGND